MPVAVSPTSPLAKRVVQGIQRFVGGTPTIVGADLGLDPALAPERTTLGDDPALLRMLRAQKLHKTLFGSEEDTSRRSDYFAFREMYDRGAELSACLDIIVDFVFGGMTSEEASEEQPFEVIFSESASQVLRDEVDRVHRELALFILVPQIFQQGLLLGDANIEFVMSLTKIVKAVPHSPWDVNVIWDAFKSLIGYSVKSSVRGMGGGAGAAKTLHPLQMLHYAPKRELNHRYGQSLFKSLKGDHRMFVAVISATVIGVMLQGSNRTNVTYQVPKGWTSGRLQKFIASLKLWNADSFFFNDDGDLARNVTQLLDFDDRIYPYRQGMDKPSFDHELAMRHESNIAVANFLQDREFIGCGVPKALAGLLKDANSRAALEAQGMHFVKRVRFWQKDAALITLEILARAALVARIPFGPDDIQVRMPIVSEFNEKLIAEVRKLQAEAAKILALDVRIPMEWILINILKVPRHQVGDIVVAMGAGQTADERTGQAPSQSAAELLLANEAMKEQIERLSEDVQTLIPVTVTLKDLLSSRVT